MRVRHLERITNLKNAIAMLTSTQLKIKGLLMQYRAGRINLDGLEQQCKQIALEQAANNWERDAFQDTLTDIFLRIRDDWGHALNCELSLTSSGSLIYTFEDYDGDE